MSGSLRHCPAIRNAVPHNGAIAQWQSAVLARRKSEGSIPRGSTNLAWRRIPARTRVWEAPTALPGRSLRGVRPLPQGQNTRGCSSEAEHRVAKTDTAGSIPPSAPPAGSRPCDAGTMSRSVTAQHGGFWFRKSRFESWRDSAAHFQRPPRHMENAGTRRGVEQFGSSLGS